MTTRTNYCICFDLNGENAYLNRFDSQDGTTRLTRSKEYEYGFHEFKNTKSFKASILRYLDKCGYPTKVVLNGVDITGAQAEVVTEFIINTL